MQRSQETNDDEELNHHATVERLLVSFSNGENDLELKNTIRRQQSSVKVQQRVAARRKVRQTKALTKAAVFAGIDTTATEAVLSAMEYNRYEKGTIICEEGAIANIFYIIVSGQCKATTNTWGSEPMHVGDIRALDIMGENALVYGDDDVDAASKIRVRSATVRVVSDVVQTLELHRSEFERLLEMGVIGQEVVQRMRSVQKSRREVREAIHHPPR